MTSREGGKIKKHHESGEKSDDCKKKRKNILKAVFNYKNVNPMQKNYSVQTSSTKAIFLSCEIVSSPASIVI